MTAAARLRFTLALGLACVPALAHAGPPEVFEPIEIRGTRTSGNAVALEATHAVPPAPDAETLAALPRTAREAWAERTRAAAEREGIERAMRERGISTTVQGPAHRAVIAREEAAQARLAGALERMGGSLSPGGWLLLGELRRAEAMALRARGGGADPARALTAARTAYAQAAATGGTTPAALWARLRESTLAAETGDVVNARSGLAVVIANAPVGPVRAAALVELATLSSGATAARLYARANAEGADDTLRARLRVAAFVASRYSDPPAARAAGIGILGEPNEAAAALAIPLVGELLVRTGDPSGSSLPATLPTERVARTLAAAAEAAIAANEPEWADAAWKALGERAPQSPLAAEAATRRTTLAAQRPARPEAFEAWLIRQATRCHGDAVAASEQPVTGGFDVMVRRVRGTLRVIVRARGSATAGGARFDRCLEGTVPDSPSVDSSTVHQGLLLLR
jgi:hypothetical protein